MAKKEEKKAKVSKDVAKPTKKTMADRAKKMAEARANTISTGAMAEALAKKFELGAKQADDIMREIITAIKDHVKAGKSVQLYGIGTFSKVERAARKARNPMTGDTVKVPAKLALKFKASNQIKTFLNESTKRAKKSDKKATKKVDKKAGTKK